MFANGGRGHINPQAPTRQTVSLPRRAMEQMGFSVCCLACDAPDTPGTQRCRDCISSHNRTRERLLSGKAKTKAQRLAREQMSMLSDPGSYIFDDDHGEWMLEYKRLIDSHQEPAHGERSKGTTKPSKPWARKRSIIRDVANQNKWTNNPPNEEEIQEMRSLLKGDDGSEPMTWDDLINEIEEILED